MGNEQKNNFENGGDDIQKWVNLSTFWKIPALGVW